MQPSIATYYHKQVLLPVIRTNSSRHNISQKIFHQLTSVCVLFPVSLLCYTQFQPTIWPAHHFNSPWCCCIEMAMLATSFIYVTLVSPFFVLFQRSLPEAKLSMKKHKSCLFMQTIGAVTVTNCKFVRLIFNWHNI